MTSNTDLERVELEHEIVAGVVSAAGGDALSQLLQIGLQLGVLHLQVLKLWKAWWGGQSRSSEGMVSEDACGSLQLDNNGHETRLEAVKSGHIR